MWISVFITYLFYVCISNSNDNSISITFIFIKSEYKWDNFIENWKENSSLKGSGPDYTCANTDYLIAWFVLV